ncbi:tetratricopeptide repeat protein [bacterium]|nr:tetratricopeptide repeat protein [bacterium]
MNRFRTIFFVCVLVAGCLAVYAGDGTVQQCMAVGDSLDKAGDHDGALKVYLKILETDSLDYDALWNAGDQYTEVAKALPDDAKDAKEEKFDLARQYCEKAIAVNPEGWEGHTYLAIALGRLALFRGGKEKINLSKRVKAEADRGIELNPDNDLAYHVVGLWHRNLANLSWVLKSFAKILYGGVPPGSNDEAVACLKKAIEIKPTYINHHLELAKTYKEIGKKELMREPLEKVIALPATEAEDDEYKAEAEELLKELK